MPPSSSRIKVYVRLRPYTPISATASSFSAAAAAAGKSFTFDVPSSTITIRGGAVPDREFFDNDNPSLPASASSASLNYASHSDGSSYAFDSVLPPSHPQGSVFNSTTVPLLRAVSAGVNATLLTYGQTGAGKTYTTFGPTYAAGAGDQGRGKGGYDERGIAARAIGELFEMIGRGKSGRGVQGGHVDQHQQHKLLLDGQSAAAWADTEVRVSCLEIYNEHMYDLLGFGASDATRKSAPLGPSLGVGAANSAAGGGGASSSSSSSSSAPPPLSLYEVPDPDGSGGSTVHVRNLSRPVASTADDALNYLFESQVNRAIAEHQLNEASSRSHCIFTLHLVRRYAETSGSGASVSKVVSSKLNIVDLAGSERLAKTSATGNVARESAYINKSLSFLEQVVVALGAKKKRDHIPYRQCKLTHVLKDSVGGNCETGMIACIWPSAEHMDQTISTLSFAGRMMGVKNKPVVNESAGGFIGGGGDIMKLGRIIKNLKEELAMRDVISGGHIRYAEPSEADIDDLRACIEAFVENEEKMPDLSSVAQYRAMMREMRSMLVDARGRTVMTISPRRRDDEGEAQESVGEIEQQRSQQNVDAAPRLSPEKNRQAEKRPSPNKTRIDDEEAAARALFKQQQGQHAEEPSLALRPSIEVDVMAQKADFELFTSTTAEGKSLAQDLDECKRRLKARKKVVKDIADEVNYQKDRIDFLIAQMTSGASASPRAGHSPGSGTGESNSNDPTVQLKIAKSSYRNKLDAFNQGKEELKFLSHQKDVCFQTLIARFDKWITSGRNHQSSPSNKQQHNRNSGGTTSSRIRDPSRQSVDDNDVTSASPRPRQQQSPHSGADRETFVGGRGQNADAAEEDAPAYTSQQYDSALVRASSRGRLNRSGEVKWKS